MLLFGSFGDGREIADPFFGPIEGFEKCYEQCRAYSEGFLIAMFP